MNITLTGIDLSKEVFEVRSENHNGGLVRRATVSRKQLPRLLAQLPTGSRVAMEACGGSNYWARRCESLGLKAVLIAPQFVKPYRKSQKNDVNDAQAICEAARRPTMRFVPIKTEEQSELQMLHGVREQLIKFQTSLVNQTRALLFEHGITIPKTVSSFRSAIPELLEDPLSELFTFILKSLWERFCEIEKEVEKFTKKIASCAKSNEQCQQIIKLEGIGPITATAIVASMGSAKAYKNGRDYASSLGVVPRQFSTGGKSSLGGITKAGNGYVRKLLVHGARSVIRHSVNKKKNDHLSLWIRQLHARKGTNITSVALANKTARHVWAVLAGKTPLEPALPQHVA